MNACDQLTMFEPAGAELAILAKDALAMSAALERQAGHLADRQFTFAARSFEHQSVDWFEKAQVFETAYQFEQLAGLS